MAEALINAKMGACVEAESSGVQASGEVNPQARAVLKSRGLWRESYHSKRIESMLNRSFDLVVTVCDAAKESCPLFPNAVKTIHVGFEDPSGKAAEAYEKSCDLIEKELLPVIEAELCRGAQHPGHSRQKEERT